MSDEQMMYDPQMTFFFTKEGAMAFGAELIAKAMTMDSERQHLKAHFGWGKLHTWTCEIAVADEM